MTTIIKALSYAGVSSLTLALLSPAISHAETGQAAATGSHSLVHRVSHSLADATSYTGSPNAGYKWGKERQPSSAEVQWAEESQARGGYKWGQSEGQMDADAPTYAGTASYEWATMSFPEQAAYKWGLRSYADQTAYKWGLRSYADQTAYKWGLR
jgi:hypothetical protein